MPRPEAILRPRVLGVLAGRDLPLEMLAKWAKSAHIVLAADQGADHLRTAGVEPHVVIGDFDSIRQVQDWAETEVVHDPGQSKTDCDKLLAYAKEHGLEAITLAAVEGDQLDHVLATLHSAARTSISVRLALRKGVGWILKGGDEVEVRTAKGRRVSLLPLQETTGVFLSGVEWPLDGADLHPVGLTSISNRAIDPIVMASLTHGTAFLFVGFEDEELPLW